RQLYLNAGIELQYEGEPAQTEPPNTTAKPTTALSASAPAIPSMHGEDAVDNFARITEITRNIYRQSNVKGVLFAAANDVGRHWNASRCIASLCSPGKPPSAALEYCAPGVKQSDVMSIVRLIGALQAVVVQRGSAMIENVSTARELESIGQHVESLELKSALAAPLMDGDEHVGIIILEQIDRQRHWSSTDAVI